MFYHSASHRRCPLFRPFLLLLLDFLHFVWPAIHRQCRLPPPPPVSAASLFTSAGGGGGSHWFPWYIPYQIPRSLPFDALLQSEAKKIVMHGAAIGVDCGQNLTLSKRRVVVPKIGDHSWSLSRNHFTPRAIWFIQHLHTYSVYSPALTFDVLSCLRLVGLQRDSRFKLRGYVCTYACSWGRRPTLPSLSQAKLPCPYLPPQSSSSSTSSSAASLIASSSSLSPASSVFLLRLRVVVWFRNAHVCGSNSTTLRCRSIEIRNLIEEAFPRIRAKRNLTMAGVDGGWW